MRHALLVLLLAGCNEVKEASRVALPPSDDTFFAVPPVPTAADLAPFIEVGLQTPEKGPDATYFIVVQSMERQPPEVKDPDFNVVVGAGVRYPKGALRIRKKWIASGQIDGTNEELQTLGVSVAIERGAEEPYAREVVAAVTAFCEALAARVPIHPDCVVAMEDVPYANTRPQGAAERQLVETARRRIPTPPAPFSGHVTKAGGERVDFTYEKRDTHAGIRVGMMMRRRFDGPERGMLFVYAFEDYRHFWMRNCFIPIDVAYIRAGQIDEIFTMTPQAGKPQSQMPRYNSSSAVKVALEMPSGWFGRHGIEKGDRIELE